MLYPVAGKITLKISFVVALEGKTGYNNLFQDFDLAI